MPLMAAAAKIREDLQQQEEEEPQLRLRDAVSTDPYHIPSSSDSEDDSLLTESLASMSQLAGCSGTARWGV